MNFCKSTPSGAVNLPCVASGICLRIDAEARVPPLPATRCPGRVGVDPYRSPNLGGECLSRESYMQSRPRLPDVEAPTNVPLAEWASLPKRFVFRRIQGPAFLGPWLFSDIVLSCGFTMVRGAVTARRNPFTFAAASSFGGSGTASCFGILFCSAGYMTLTDRARRSSQLPMEREPLILLMPCDSHHVRVGDMCCEMTAANGC